jgi:hypothetical protein
MKLRISKGGRGKQMKKEAENLSDDFQTVTPDDIYPSPEVRLSRQLHAAAFERGFSVIPVKGGEQRNSVKERVCNHFRL